MARLHLQKSLTTCYIMGLLLLPVHFSSLQAAGTAAGITTGHSDVETENRRGEVGTATYYAKRYQNRRTSSGVRYDAAKLTAAHPTLPHGTKVRVINLTNNREVTVTINDRCRPRKGPCIDLSRAAANRLGFLGKGKTRVRIIQLDEEDR